MLLGDVIYNSDFTFDSREVGQNSVFIALTTGVQDGNNFAESAFKKGAKFLILSKKPEFEISAEKYIVVQDTLEFITELAKNKIKEYQKNGVKIINLTGSVGKTTAKDFLVFLLNKAGKKVFGNVGNFNNHIGVPITILNAPKELEFLVLEMGMNHEGEISHLIKIAAGCLRIITNISPAHIGNFKEGLLGIAKAKGEILEESTLETIFIAPESLLFLKEITKNFKGKIKFAYPIENYEIKQGRVEFEVCNNRFSLNKVVTREWLISLSVGFKALEVFQIPLPLEISVFTPAEGRGNEVCLSKTCTLIDESYNASPEAMLNAIKTLMLSGPVKKLLVIGAMRELGEEAHAEHKKIVEFVKGLQNTDVIFVEKEFGEFDLQYEFAFQSNFCTYSYFPSVEQLIENFPKEKALEYNFILVKASKSCYLSKFVNHLN